jgi:hypothetical protein
MTSRVLVRFDCHAMALIQELCLPLSGPSLAKEVRSVHLPMAQCRWLHMYSELLRMQLSIPMGRWLIETVVPYDLFQMIGYIRLRGIRPPQPAPTCQSFLFTGSAPDLDVQLRVIPGPFHRASTVA